MMKFCPFRSTDEKTVDCSHNCALFTENGTCAVLTISSIDVEKITDCVLDALDNIRYSIDNK